MHISQPSPAAFQNDLPAVVSGHVRDDLSRFQILNNRALGHLNDQILSVGTVAAAFSAFFPTLRHIFADVPEIMSLIHISGSFQHERRYIPGSRKTA